MPFTFSIGRISVEEKSHFDSPPEFHCRDTFSQLIGIIQNRPVSN
jgi:hypothetical protein